jgi:hypothetical protein
MFARRELVALEERRRRLLIESEVNRRMLVAHARDLQGAIKWIDNGASLWRNFRRYALILAPVAAYLLVRRKGKTSGLLEKAAGWARLFQRFARIWESFQTRPGRAGEPAGSRNEGRHQ